MAKRTKNHLAKQKVVRRQVVEDPDTRPSWLRNQQVDRSAANERHRKLRRACDAMLS